MLTLPSSFNRLHDTLLPNHHRLPFSM
jgi:hypothetical protein